MDKCFSSRDIFKGMSVSKNLIFGLIFFVLVSVIFTSSVSGQDATRKVKVIPVDGGPSVLVESIPPDTKSYPVISCLDQTFKDTYLGTKEKYEAFLVLKSKEATCAQGYAQAAMLSAKYVDASNSVVAITTRIASLQKVSAYLDSLKDINGLSLRAIPAGDIADTSHATAVNISVQCLKDSTGNIIASSVAVGDEQSASGQIFREVSREQSALFEELRRENAELKEQSVDKTKKVIDKGMDLGLFFLDVVQKVAKDFIPVLPEDLEQMYHALSKNHSYLSLDISFFLKNGKVQKSNELGKMEGYKGLLEIRPFKGKQQIDRIAKLTKLLSHPTLKDPFVGVDLKLDEIIYSDVWVPEMTVSSDIKAATANHLKRYEDLKTKFEKARDGFKAELDTLKKNNYNCS